MKDNACRARNGRLEFRKKAVAGERETVDIALSK